LQPHYKREANIARISTAKRLAPLNLDRRVADKKPLVVDGNIPQSRE
jgi:hypothetical protein